MAIAIIILIASLIQLIFALAKYQDDNILYSPFLYSSILLFASTTLTSVIIYYLCEIRNILDSNAKTSSSPTVAEKLSRMLRSQINPDVDVDSLISIDGEQIKPQSEDDIAELLEQVQSKELNNQELPEIDPVDLDKFGK